MRGAFTGAVADRRGKFELAHGGTIFLDEIGDMSLKTQAKVLRVLQEQVMEAVGGSTRIRVDARVLAATNKDLPAEIRAGRFREDLYFRLNVVPIFVPPLRERQEDIPLLADHFMAMLAREYGRRPKTFDADAVAALQRYPWPGNVRELRNLVERLMIMVPGDRVVGARPAVPRAGRSAPAADRRSGRRRHRAAARRARRVRARVHPARARRAAGQHLAHRRVLGVERSNLYRKMRASASRPPRRSEDEEIAEADDARSSRDSEIGDQPCLHMWRIPIGDRMLAGSCTCDSGPRFRLPQLRFEHLLRVEALELQQVLRRCRRAQRPGTRPTISLSSTSTP